MSNLRTCGGCVALSAQLDEAKRVIGDDLMAEHDGYVHEAIDTMQDDAVRCTRLLQEYRVQARWARAVADWARSGYVDHGHCAVCGAYETAHDETCLYVALRNALERCDAEERRTKHD